MCVYVKHIHEVIDKHFAEGKAFTALEIRDAVRVLAPHQDVRYRECKYETLTYFEDKAPKGWKALPTNVSDTLRVWTFAPSKWRLSKKPLKKAIVGEV